MPPRGKSGRAEPTHANRFASSTQFDALAVDQLPSDSDDIAQIATDAEPRTPRTRAAAKRAAKSKSSSAASTPPVKEETSSDAVLTHRIKKERGADAKAAAPSPAPRKSAAPASTSASDEAATHAAATPTPFTQAGDGEVSRAFWKKVRERTVFSLLMIAGFLTILLMGPSYMILLVLVIETLVYREVTALFNIPGRASLTGSTRASQSEGDEEVDAEQRRQDKRRQEVWSKTLSWYFFAVCNFFLYGESLIYYFKHVVYTDSFFLQFARHHRFISFMLYIFGFMAFVTNLRRRYLKYQFGLFCWVHMSLMLIVMSSHFIVNNILEGMIWFWLPASLVICNDIFAYVCGMLFGRTPLISLSPKKTVEGFVGALFITMAFSWFWAGIFQRFDFMVCPAVNLGMTAFSNISCDRNPAFLTRETPLPSMVSNVLSAVLRHPVTTFTWSPFQCHALVMAAFASLVAPFGGFFASGFKRAFNIKDFGDSIPGHGGLTDRFDCQFIMGLFSYVYYSSLIRESRITVGHVMQIIVTQMPVEKQTELLRELSRYLTSEGHI
ncbi:phosphatidate cytidylyltransferase [Malassezia furfur]|uniref:Phosphatidate cytidylyltransferase n=1 Tax=Malassezia furfur TaxID=55194 RepID=A0ABY8ENY3_MALFU|nr:CDS1 [Malassezia furfur]WFD46599.1 phosphatidate cytidylyltransferase [Malassezia furfur]